MRPTDGRGVCMQKRGRRNSLASASRGSPLSFSDVCGGHQSLLGVTQESLRWFLPREFLRHTFMDVVLRITTKLPTEIVVYRQCI
jgi:hypothetical protein